MFSSEHLQVWQPRHGAVVIHDFANHRRRAAAGHRRQITARFGMTCAHQDTTVYSLQRENMAWLHQVFRHRSLGNRRLHRAGAVRRRNASRHALSRLNRRGKCGPFFVAVVCRHGWQFEQFAAFARQREADQPAPEPRHEVDGFRADVVGSKHQVALVFAILFIDQNHDAPGAHVGHDVLYRRYRNGLLGREVLMCVHSVALLYVEG